MGRKFNYKLPDAPVQEFVVAGTTYVGANPVLSPMQLPGGAIAWIKTAKGVPWKKKR